MNLVIGCCFLGVFIGDALIDRCLLAFNAPHHRWQLASTPSVLCWQWCSITAPVFCQSRFNQDGATANYRLLLLRTLQFEFGCPLLPLTAATMTVVTPLLAVHRGVGSACCCCARFALQCCSACRWCARCAHARVTGCALSLTACQVRT